MHSEDSVPTGIKLLIDERGYIQQVIQNDIGVVGLAPGQMLWQIVDPGSRIKLLNFLVEIRATGAAFNWEINILNERLITVYLSSGAFAQDLVAVVFATTPVASLSLLDDLVKTNHPPESTLRTAIMHQMQLVHGQNKDLGPLLDDISQLNNDLVTIQRDLAKKNILLEQHNAQGKVANLELDRHLQERSSQLEESQKSRRDLFNRCRIVADNTYNWEYWLDVDESFIYTSPSCKRVTGYVVEDFMNDPGLLLHIIHPDDLPAWRQHHQKQTNDPDHQQIEFRIRRPDGSECWVNHVCQPVYDELGNFLGTRASNNDISERKKVEEINRKNQVELQRLLGEAERSRRALLGVIEDQKEAEEAVRQLNAELEERVRARTTQLEAANQELEAFAYSVSHDLRAPLRGIDGMSAALSEDYQDRLDEQGLHYLERIRSETRRMGHMIEDILQLSRITRVEMKREPVNLTLLAQTILDRLQETESERQVRAMIDPNMIAFGDPNLLEIMLTNLLSNAWKFTGKQPQATIEFGNTLVAGQPVFFIRDNGAGFDMAYSKNLFGAFQRMHKQSDFPGTGIGLATVQRIIRRHGGKVWAEAQKDQGATFYFSFEEKK